MHRKDYFCYRPINQKPVELHFTIEERLPTRRSRSILSSKSSNTSSDNGYKKTQNENSNTQQRTVQADNGKKAVRLHFKEAEQKKPSKLAHIAKEALAAEIHKQLDDSADENVAIEAAHRTEQVAEAGYRLADEHTHAPKAQSARAATTLLCDAFRRGRSADCVWRHHPIVP